jgi:CBS domain-containing protein
MNVPISALLERKNPGIHSVAPYATIYIAVQKMIKARIGSVLVVDGGKLVGIFTERDALVRVVGPNLNPMTTPISAVMTPDPVSIEPTTSIQEVIDLQGEKGIRHLPVVAEGRLVGMISSRDILHWVAQHTVAQAG